MFIDIDKKNCLVAGGGTVALRKVRVLLDFGACVTVVAPEIHPEIQALSGHGVQFFERMFVPEDLGGCTLVVAATDDTAQNHAIAQLAKQAGIWVNAVDQQEDCSFIFPSYVRKQNLVGAFSSAGNSPVITQYLKETVKDVLTQELGQINEYMGSIRPQVKELTGTEPVRRQIYQTVLKRLLTEEKTQLSPEELKEIITLAAQAGERKRKEENQWIAQED